MDHGAATATITVASREDAAAIAELIRRVIRISNAADYTPEQVEVFAASFTPQSVAEHVASRHVLAMLLGREIVGTASLDQGFLRSVYVEPARQGRGLGSRLCEAVEQEARRRGRLVLDVQSSVTAHVFYQRRGYSLVRDFDRDGERIIMMRKRLG